MNSLRLVLIVAAAAIACTSATFQAAQCNATYKSGHSVNMSSIPTATFLMNEVFKGHNSSYTFVVNPCTPVNQPPLNRKPCAVGDAYIASYGDSDCKTAFSEPSSPFWVENENGDGFNRKFANVAEGWSARLTLSCGSTLTMQPVGDVEVITNSALQAQFNMHFSTSAVCKVPPKMVVVVETMNNNQCGDGVGETQIYVNNKCYDANEDSFGYQCAYQTVYPTCANFIINAGQLCLSRGDVQQYPCGKCLLNEKTGDYFELSNCDTGTVSGGLYMSSGCDSQCQTCNQTGTYLANNQCANIGGGFQFVELLNVTQQGCRDPVVTQPIINYFGQGNCPNDGFPSAVYHNNTCVGGQNVFCVAEKN